jgi:hypothetical protein
MGKLSKIEVGTFLNLFNRGGYVLNFTTNEFDVFTMGSIGVALCSEYNMSKGKSLAAYVNQASDEDVTKLLRDLLEYYEENYENDISKTLRRLIYLDYTKYNATYAALYKKCRTYMDRVLNISTPLASNAVALQENSPASIFQSKLSLCSGCRRRIQRMP